MFGTSVRKDSSPSARSLGGGVALWFGDSNFVFAMPLMLLAGVLGGMVWAAIPAFPDPFQYQRNSCPLMLVYIAQLVLSWLVPARGAILRGKTIRGRRGLGGA